MTRINAGISVQQLCDQHLIAEYHEILRVGILFKNRIDSGKGFDDSPFQFTLGQGHVKFFFRRGLYISKRWKQLHREMWQRHFKPEIEYIDAWNGNAKYFHDWIPTVKATRMIKERIVENIRKQKGPIRFYGKTIEKEIYIKTILKHKEAKRL